jgi:hypothetical protein
MSNGNFKTKVTQARGTYDPADETYISSHISYTIDGKNVKYNADVL